MLRETIASWPQKDRQAVQACLLLFILELEFGELDESIKQRVNSASEEQLLRWVERVLTVPKLVDVLRDE